MFLSRISKGEEKPSNSSLEEEDYFIRNPLKNGDKWRPEAKDRHHPSWSWDWFASYSSCFPFIFFVNLWGLKPEDDYFLVWLQISRFQISQNKSWFFFVLEFSFCWFSGYVLTLCPLMFGNWFKVFLYITIWQTACLINLQLIIACCSLQI